MIAARVLDGIAGVEIDPDPRTLLIVDRIDAVTAIEAVDGDIIAAPAVVGRSDQYVVAGGRGRPCQRVIAAKADGGVRGVKRVIGACRKDIGFAAAQPATHRHPRFGIMHHQRTAGLLDNRRGDGAEVCYLY